MILANIVKILSFNIEDNVFYFVMLSIIRLLIENNEDGESPLLLSASITPIHKFFFFNQFTHVDLPHVNLRHTLRDRFWERSDQTFWLRPTNTLRPVPSS